MTQVTKRFNPGSKGFEVKDIETWSADFVNKMLDVWFSKDPLAFDKMFDARKGIGREMLKGLNKNRANAFARWRNEIIGTARRATENSDS